MSFRDVYIEVGKLSSKRQACADIHHEFNPSQFGNKYITFQELHRLASPRGKKRINDPSVIVVSGYLGALRRANKNTLCGMLADPHMRHTIQIIAQEEIDSKAPSKRLSKTKGEPTPKKPSQEKLIPASEGRSSRLSSIPPVNSHLTTEAEDNSQEKGYQASQFFPSTSQDIRDDPSDADDLDTEEASSPKFETTSTATDLDDSLPDSFPTSSMLQSSESSLLPNTDTLEIPTTQPSRGPLEDHHEPAGSEANVFDADKQKDRTKMSFTEIFSLLRSTPPHSPITIWGRVKSRKIRNHSELASDQHFGKVNYILPIEIHLSGVQVHNTDVKTQRLDEDMQFPPEQRHLQIRTSSDLRRTLRHRSRAMALIRQKLFKAGFDEIETPLLFKPSREGAREYIVPTRKHGMAYALPQSPQQYKQILMASGIAKYFQFAKCFRDEDLRTDRQPEFTQVDMEMSFADRHKILSTMEPVIRFLWQHMGSTIKDTARDFCASNMSKRLALPFDELEYEEAMCSFGSDKPDRRIGSVIIQPPYIPFDLVCKITTIANPTIDMMKFVVSKDPNVSRKFIAEFLESDAGSQFRPNATSAPGIFIFDESKPMDGLSAFGFEAAAKVNASLDCESGDVIIITARSNKRISGSSTVMGDMRLALFHEAVKQGYRSAICTDDFLWVTHFPMFEETDGLSEPGQGGRAGIKARHHPFTTPVHKKHLVWDLIHDPMKVKGDSWDLVINGVEVGGGSVRIHQADMQELIFRDVLKMSPEDIEAFRPLLNALAAACPPHAGMALGFDRLIAVLLGKSSIRDVIAFPKYGTDGTDRMAGSPAPITEEQLETYCLQLGKTPSQSAVTGVRFH